MQNCIDFVYSGQDSAKNLWGKHRDSMRRPEIDGRQAFCLKRKSRFRENRLTDYRLTVDSYLKILLQQEHRQLFPLFNPIPDHLWETFLVLISTCSHGVHGVGQRPC